MTQLVKRQVTVKLPTKYGDFELITYEDQDKINHVVLLKKPIRDPTIVRVHSECLTGDVFRSLRCDCGDQLDYAMSLIGKQGGVLVYLRQEGRGIGLANKIRAYKLQDEGLDTVEANEKLGFKADQRDYTIGAQILAGLGIKNIRLITNNPKKIKGLEKYSLKIVERIPIVCINENNKRYLKTKKEKLGHLIEDEGIIKN